MTVPIQLQQLQDRLDDLERERAKLLALVEILREVSGARGHADIVQAVVRRLGQLFGLDRCSALLASRAGRHEVHLVASFEDPSIRNYPVDLSRYPEIRLAMETRQVVYIPDAQADPTLSAISNQLASRRVKSITVVPMTWGERVIGTLFLRTDQTGQQVTEDDIEFSRVVADVTARALRLAHRLARLRKRVGGSRRTAAALRGVALVSFTHRLMAEFLARENGSGGQPLPEAWSKELDRLVTFTLAAVGLDDRPKGGQPEPGQAGPT